MVITREHYESYQCKVFIVGLITNFGTFLTLAINGEEFAPCIRLLLKHQSLIDAFACLVAALQILQTPFWVTGAVFIFISQEENCIVLF